jgi:Sec-independent protein translocase protein TatA
MNRKLTISIFLLLLCCNFQQAFSFDSTYFENRLSSFNQKITSQDELISNLDLKILSLEKSNDSLISLLNKNDAKIHSITQEFQIKIQETGNQADSKFSQLAGRLDQEHVYWIIATLLIIFIGVLMFLFLRKRITSSQKDVETQIKATKKSLDEESMKLDSELIKVFQKQIEVLENSSKVSTQENDHSLVLKIADRLTAMETNLYRMDPNTRGLNNLKNLVKSTKENFNAKEYEIVEMLGIEYKEGMEVIATFIPSDEIEIGKKIITRVIKPQVNFKGTKIQAAQIEVSIGE